MTLIPRIIRYPEMTLTPAWGFPSGRIMRKSLRQINDEAQWRAQLPKAIAVEAGRYIALAARIVAAVTLVLLGVAAEGIAYLFTAIDKKLTKAVEHIVDNAPLPPWQR